MLMQIKRWHMISYSVIVFYVHLGASVAVSNMSILLALHAINDDEFDDY